jgi:hypothetical protein
MKIKLQKYYEEGARFGVLLPEHGDEESEKFVDKLKLKETIVADFKKPRNYEFHKKWFALVKFAYDHWEPSAFQNSKWEGVVPEKSFDRFRKDLIILSGRYDAVYRVDGSVRIEAKSISFANMNQEEFKKLYNSTVNVILDKILTTYSLKDLEEIVKKVEAFY